MSALYEKEEISELYSIQKVKNIISTDSFNIGNYEDVNYESGSNSTIIDYVFKNEQKPRYEGLKNLVEEWLSESGDYDLQIWPEIEKNIINQKIKFRAHFD